MSRARAAREGQTGSMSELLQRHRRVLPAWMSLYYEQPLELVSGQGCRVTDAAGRSYLDFFAGILTNMLGYDVPEVRDAVQRQLATGIVHTSTLYLIRSQVELAEKLARLSGIEDAKVFFTNSGTEANETALMLATTARRSNQVLALRGSYHGRSFGAVAVTGNRGWKSSPLAPFAVHYLHGTDRHLPGFARLSDAEYIAACTEDLRHLLAAGAARDVACLIAEPVQGVGGFTMPPDGLLGEYQKVLAGNGILLICDEVQTGWGRTGEHFWGFQAHGAVPDMITFAKGLGNGFAIGGVIARGDLMDALPGTGISTFGGNPLATTAANATLDYLLDHDLQANAAALGRLIIGGLAEAAGPLAVAGEVRGKGLMFAVDLVDPATGAPSPDLATRMLEETRERGLLVGKGGLFGHTLRMAPPMTLTEAEAKEGLGILVDALRETDAAAAREARR
jgi:4-aminobutyrate aminotransferase